MPTYDYKCLKCKKDFTIISSIKDYEKNPNPKCEHCGSNEVKRIYINLNVITSKKS